MHNKRIVHRDLKLRNIVFDGKGENGILKIIDFGESELIQNPNDDDVRFCGTFYYMPPGIL